MFLGSLGGVAWSFPSKALRNLFHRPLVLNKEVRFPCSQKERPMRQLLFVVVLSLLSSATAVRADDAPGPIEALAGGWVRPWVMATKDGEDFVVAAMVPSKDGKTYVTPGLSIVPHGKTGKLVLGGTPSIVYWNPGPTVHGLVVPEGAKDGELAIAVVDQGLVREVRFTFTLEKDTLTIQCKEKVPAGPWLGAYNISGTWMRTSNRPNKGYVGVFVTSAQDVFGDPPRLPPKE